jgi:hypothetical protein
MGDQALYSNTTNSNSAFGAQALYEVTAGQANTAIGFASGRGITTGNYNTILGANVTGLSATLSNNIIIADGQGNRRINVDSSGNVGIGTTGPSTKLEVVGTITCTTMIETSSVVAKTNVKKLTSQTAKIAKLSPVSFNYKKDNKRSLGLIAEEVAQVYPELVEYENGRPLGVNYSKLTSVLISAVNELAAELAELKKQLNK